MSPNEIAAAIPTSDAEFQQMVLRYWLRQLRDLDDVTVIVRRRGRIVRTMLVNPDGDPTPIDVSSAPPRRAPGE